MTAIERYADELQFVFDTWRKATPDKEFSREGFEAVLRRFGNEFVAETAEISEQISAEEALSDFFESFLQDTSGERVSGYLLAPSVGDSVKVALPGDVAPFVRAAWHRGYAAGAAKKEPCPGPHCQKTPVGKCVACWNRDNSPTCVLGKKE